MNYREGVPFKVKPAVEQITKVIQEAEPERFVLELTREQAETLRIVTGYIGGSPSTSRRGHMDSIGNALWKMGVRNVASREGVPPNPVQNHETAGIHFRDEV